MPIRSLLSLLAVAAGIGLASPAAALLVTGSISEGDHIATDSSGSFVYDLFVLTNTTGVAQQFTLSLDAEEPMQPWLGYWTSPVLPTPHWEVPDDIYALAAGHDSSGVPGATVTLLTSLLAAGASIQIAVATHNYIVPIGVLGDYQLSIAGDAQTLDEPTLTQSAPQRVPEPLTLALVGLGLLAAGRRPSFRPAPAAG